MRFAWFARSLPGGVPQTAPSAATIALRIRNPCAAPAVARRVLRRPSSQRTLSAAMPTPPFMLTQSLALGEVNRPAAVSGAQYMARLHPGGGDAVTAGRGVCRDVRAWGSAMRVEVGGMMQVDRELPLHVTLIHRMPANDADALIEKATELASRRCSRCVRALVLRLAPASVRRKSHTGAALPCQPTSRAGAAGAPNREAAVLSCSGRPRGW